MKVKKNPKEIEYSLDLPEIGIEEREDMPVLEFRSLEELKKYFESIPDGPCNIEVRIVREGEIDAGK